jgi:hypothetical protein
MCNLNLDAQGNLKKEATKELIRQLLKKLMLWTRRLEQSEGDR